MSTRAQAELDRFIDSYSPLVAQRGSRCIDKLREGLPWANLLVYDNYNALAVAFSASEQLSGAILSLTFYPRWISLFFVDGASLPDPSGLLKGMGKQMRHLVLESEDMIDQPAVRELIAAAVAQKRVEGEAPSRGNVLIKSAATKRRPRRPS